MLSQILIVCEDTSIGQMKVLVQYLLFLELVSASQIILLLKSLRFVNIYKTLFFFSETDIVSLKKLEHILMDSHGTGFLKYCT